MHRIDVEALVVMLMCAVILTLFYGASQPIIDVFPSAKEPDGVWHARIARAHQRYRDEWRGPLLTPVQRERRQLMVELRVYTREMQLLQNKPLLTATERAALRTYASNFAVALCLTTNSAALSAHLTATGRDKPESWWPWLIECFVVYVVLLGGFASLFMFYSIRFVRRLLGYQSKTDLHAANKDGRCP